MEGWIKLHTKLLEWEWVDIPEMFNTWVQLLLRASCKDTIWKGVNVKRGQVVTSVASLAKATGFSVKQIRTCLRRLVETGEITSKTTNKFTIITICKYDTYQTGEADEGQAKGQTKGKQKGKQKANAASNVTTFQTNDYEGNIFEGGEQRASERATSKDIESISKDISSISAIVSKKSDSLDYARIQAMWKETCPSLKKVMLMTDSRKRQVTLRAKEMKAAYPDRDIYDVLHDFFAKVEASDFLKGGGSQGWKADFDWLFSNDRRWVKTMEGGFDNTGQKARGNAQLDVNSLWD